MASIFPIIAQGIISAPGKIIYTPNTGNEGVINNIRINNTASTSYTVSLYRYIKAKTTTILLYKFVLDSGDVLNDDTDYKIKYGDNLYLECNIDTVTYVVNGIENLSP